MIAPYLNGGLDEKHYFLMRGQVITLAPDALARTAAGVVASSIMTASYKEIGAKPIPPPSALDLKLTSTMKVISPAMATLRTSAEASDTEPSYRTWPN